MAEFEIIKRGEWGARYANGFGPRAVGNLITRLHHSVTIAPDLVPPFTDDYAAIRALEAIGQSRFGKGMSYNTAFTPAGLIFEGLGIDRVGAHTGGANTTTAGLVLVGNYEKDKPPRRMLEAVSWYLQYGAGKWWRDAKLDGGHRDVASTACPGKYAYELIDNINRGEYREVITLPPKKEPDMDKNDKKVASDTLAEVKRVKSLVDDKVLIGPWNDKKQQSEVTLARAARLNWIQAKAARDGVNALRAEVRGLRTTVEALAKNMNLDPERIYEILDKNLQEATADLKITFSAEAEAEEEENA